MAKYLVSEKLHAFEEAIGTPEFKAKLAAENKHKVAYFEIHTQGNTDATKPLANSESAAGILIKASKLPNIDACEIRGWKAQLSTDPKVVGKQPDFVIKCNEGGTWNAPKPKAEKPEATAASEAATVPEA